MGQVLGRLLDEEGLANDVLLDVLRVVDDIDSDHNRGQIINVLIESGISPSGDSSMFSGFSTKQARSTRWPRRSSGSRARSRWAATPGRRSFAWRRTWTASDNGITPWPLWRAAAKGAEPTLNHPRSRGSICPSSGFAGAAGPVGRQLPTARRAAVGVARRGPLGSSDADPR